jgi:hypothetical protein
MARSRIVNLDNFQQFTAINVLLDQGSLGGPTVIPNAVQIVLDWTLDDGRLAHNVTYGTVAGGFTPTVAVANTLFSALSTGGLWTAFAAFLSTGTAFSGVTLRDVRSANQPLIASTGAAAPGTSASPALPNEVAVVVTLRTALTGAANRGRMFIPGWATNALASGNVVAAAAVTALQAWASSIGGIYGANSMPMALGHKARAAYTGSTGTVHPARPAGLVTITSLVVRDNHWDSQRRRGLK